MNLAMFFGAAKKKAKAKKSKAKRSPGRRPTKSGSVKMLLKKDAYVMVRSKKTGKLRKRKLYVGKNGALYYRTKSGRHYVKKSVLRRKDHVLSPMKKKAAKKGAKKAAKKGAKKGAKK